MPEAVIVATARSPDRPGRQGLARRHPARRPGRARWCAPRWTRCPQLDPHDIDDLMMGCGQPGGESGLQHRPRRSPSQLGYDFLPGTTVNRYCSSSLQTSRMAFHAIKAGEGDVVHLGRRRDRVALRRTAAPTAGRTPTTRPSPRPRQRTAKVAESGRGRVARPARGRRCCPTSTSRWARPRRTSRCSRTSAARTWTTSACARRTCRGRRSRTASGQRTSPRSRCPTAPWSPKDDGPRAGRHLRGGRRPQAGVPAGRTGHRRQLLPAQRRRRGGGDHERHQGRRARPDPAGPHRRHRRQRAVAGDHGLRPGRGDAAGAGATPA